MEDLLRGSTAVAPSLQPYVAGAGAVETGLYRFLSPISIQVISVLFFRVPRVLCFLRESVDERFRFRKRVSSTAVGTAPLFSTCVF